MFSLLPNNQLILSKCLIESPFKLNPIYSACIVDAFNKDHYLKYFLKFGAFRGYGKHCPIFSPAS